MKIIKKKKETSFNMRNLEEKKLLNISILAKVNQAIIIILKRNLIS